MQYGKILLLINYKVGDMLGVVTLGNTGDYYNSKNVKKPATEKTQLVARNNDNEHAIAGPDPSQYTEIKDREPIVDVKAWQAKIQSLKDGEYLTSEIEWINEQQVLVPVIEKNLIMPRLTTARKVVRWVKGEEDQVLDMIKQTSFGFLKCMEHHMAKTYHETELNDSDLDSLEETLEYSQQLENDSAICSEISSEKMQQYRKVISLQLLTVMKKEMTASVDICRLQRVQALWKRALNNYRLVWQCHSDPKGRIDAVNKASERLELILPKTDGGKKKSPGN
jgi:hypothetical protein